MVDDASQRTPSVLASVLNWNQYDSTVKCLGSLAQLTYSRLKVVVVDNASRVFLDADLLRQFPDVQVIRSPSNLGYAGGHRLAVDYALREGFDLIWLLNNDVLVRPDTLSELVEAYLQCGEGIYGGVPLLLDCQDRVASAFFRELNGAGQPDFSRMVPVGNPLYSDFVREGEAPRRVAQLHGSSMLIPSSVVHNYGFIEESFFLYGEETDYCLRLWRAGVPSILVPTSIIWHDSSGSSNASPALSNMLWYYRTRNRHLVARRYRDTRAYMRLLATEARAHVLALASLARRKPRAVKGSAEYFRCLGLWDAIRGKSGKRFAPEDFVTWGDADGDNVFGGADGSIRRRIAER